MRSSIGRVCHCARVVMFYSDDRRSDAWFAVRKLCGCKQYPQGCVSLRCDTNKAVGSSCLGGLGWRDKAKQLYDKRVNGNRNVETASRFENVGCVIVR